jgi:hypothetical protein
MEMEAAMWKGGARGLHLPQVQLETQAQLAPHLQPSCSPPAATTSSSRRSKRLRVYASSEEIKDIIQKQNRKNIKRQRN